MPVSIPAYPLPLGGLLGIGLSIHLARLTLSSDPGPPDTVSGVRRLNTLVELVAAGSLACVPQFLPLIP